MSQGQPLPGEILEAIRTHEADVQSALQLAAMLGVKVNRDAFDTAYVYYIAASNAAALGNHPLFWEHIKRANEMVGEFLDLPEPKEPVEKVPL